MQTLNLIQSTPEWAAHRATHFNASDCPAMMGVSPHESRDQLIARLATGIQREVDPATQRRFDEGHRIEALARPLAEEIAQEEFYPVVGVSGKYSASFDGLSMLEDVVFEHKTLNDKLRALPSFVQGQLPAMYKAQLEHQMMVADANTALFMASKWEGDALLEERHCWYGTDPVLRVAIIAGWEQLEADVAAYVPPAATAPAATGRAPDSLPALFIAVRGEVTDSNLASFKEVALAAIRSVNRELSTDQDFADADKAVKWCTDIEERVAGAKQNALSQTASIDALFKTMDDISAEARQVRLDLDKLIKARKASLKTELLVGVQTQLGDHVRSLNARIGRDYMPNTSVDFAAAIHGKKNFDSMRSALNAALANAKIETSAIADRISANMATLTELASAHKFLFGDAATIVLKANDDLAALVKTRIADHQSAESQKEEATRQRIQAEERVKAEATARAKLLAEQQAERVAAVVAVPVQQNAPQTMQEIMQPAANVIPLRVAPAAVAAPATPPSMKLGDINALLSPITLTADGLAKLGFPHAATDKSAKLYHAHDLTNICAALHDLLDRVQAKQAA